MWDDGKWFGTQANVGELRDISNWTTDCCKRRTQSLRLCPKHISMLDWISDVAQALGKHIAEKHTRNDAQSSGRRFTKRTTGGAANISLKTDSEHAAAYPVCRTYQKFLIRKRCDVIPETSVVHLLPVTYFAWCPGARFLAYTMPFHLFTRLPSPVMDA